MNMSEDFSPIAAVCTAPGPAGIAVVRLSGHGVFEIADKLCPVARVKPSEMQPGTFMHTVLHDADDASLIDEAVVLAFRAPHSYTGDDTVEFQTHGGRVPAQRVMKALTASGVRPAEAGEFTRRAFLNGRMDLSRAEAVMDIIHAQSERAGRSAAEQLTGALGNRINTIYDRLMEVCADIEASLDFADDEMSGILEPARVPERLSIAMEELKGIMATWQEGILLREGALVVLNGIPNAGKSTLFNVLLGMFRSIVTDIPGTTRDSIEETMLLDGIPLRIIDTAGIRRTDSHVERMGIDRAVSLSNKADLLLRIIDVSEDVEPQLEWMEDYDNDSVKTIVVLNKTDIPDTDSEIRKAMLALEGKYAVVSVSAETGAGLKTLKEAMSRKLLGEINMIAVHNISVSERHRQLISEALDFISQADTVYRDDSESGAVYCAQYLRSAAEAIGSITGRGYSEDLLDTVFSRFCIGK